jgi:hypothetical protein
MALYSIFVHDDGDHVTFTPIGTVEEAGGLAVVQADSLTEAKLKLAKKDILTPIKGASPEDYTFEGGGPEPKARVGHGEARGRHK